MERALYEAFTLHTGWKDPALYGTLVPTQSGPPANHDAASSPMGAAALPIGLAPSRGEPSHRIPKRRRCPSPKLDSSPMEAEMATLSPPCTAPQQPVALTRQGSDRRRTATDSMSDTQDRLYHRCRREATALQEHAEALLSRILRQRCHPQEGDDLRDRAHQYQKEADR